MNHLSISRITSWLLSYYFSILLLIAYSAWRQCFLPNKSSWEIKIPLRHSMWRHKYKLLCLFAPECIIIAALDWTLHLDVPISRLSFPFIQYIFNLLILHLRIGLLLLCLFNRLYSQKASSTGILAIAVKLRQIPMKIKKVSQSLYSSQF